MSENHLVVAGPCLRPRKIDDIQKFAVFVNTLCSVIEAEMKRGKYRGQEGSVSTLCGDA